MCGRNSGSSLFYWIRYKVVENHIQINHVPNTNGGLKAGRGNAWDKCRKKNNTEVKWKSAWKSSEGSAFKKWKLLYSVSQQPRTEGKKGHEKLNWDRLKNFSTALMLGIVQENTLRGALQDYKTWALKDLTATKTPSEKQLWYHRPQRHSSLFKWTKTTSAVWFHCHSALLCCFPRHRHNSIELILRETLHSPAAQTSNDPPVFALLHLKKALNFHTAAASGSLWRWH